jgi:uncharacterized protein
VPALAAPGVYRLETVVRPPVPPRTGVPAFVGYAEPRQAGAPAPVEVSRWARFEALFAEPPGFLGGAVRSFFENGGEVCHVVAMPPGAPPAGALRAALAALAAVDEVDLVCAPDVVWRAGAAADVPVTAADAADMVALQRLVYQHCEARGDRFALLDSLPALAVGDPANGGVLWQRARLASSMAALYYPWIVVDGGTVPPCGHVAGAVSRTDRRSGVHRAPANQELVGAVDVAAALGPADVTRLTEAQVNPLRAIPGRGIRIWGARTLAADPAWRYVSARRLVIAVERWARDRLERLAFEPNDAALWRQLRLAVSAHLEGLFAAGALAGAQPSEAFYVRCDEETNPPEVRDSGRVVVQVGLAPTVPNEFIVVQIVLNAGAAGAGPT